MRPRISIRGSAYPSVPLFKKQLKHVPQSKIQQVVPLELLTSTVFFLFPFSQAFTTKELTSEINQLSESLDPAAISYWRKDEMRQKLKTVKKELDDQVRKAQADLVGVVSAEAKTLVEKVRFIYWEGTYWAGRGFF